MDLKMILAKMEELPPGFLQQNTTTEQKAMVAKVLGLRPELSKEIDSLQQEIKHGEQIINLLETVNRELRDANDLVRQERKRTAALAAQIEGLQLELATARKSEHTLRRSMAIEGAMAMGRIFPVNREFWEQQYDKDPEGTMRTLASLPRSLMFDEIGVGTGGEEPEFTAADAKVAEKLELTQEDYRKFKPERPKQG